MVEILAFPIEKDMNFEYIRQRNLSHHFKCKLEPWLIAFVMHL